MTREMSSFVFITITHEREQQTIYNWPLHKYSLTLPIYLSIYLSIQRFFITMKNVYLTILTLLSLFLIPSCQSFCPQPLQHIQSINQHGVTTSSKSIETTTKLHGLFGNLFGKKEEQNDPSVPTRIMDIKCDSVKNGGLRLALGLFLIGQQGTPVKGSWKANQASDGVLDMYYVDNTAMFSVHITDKLIFVDRYGSPSLQYQLQESLILHRLLDEINTLALEGEEVEAENRLLVLSDPENVLKDARSKLPARSVE